MKFFCSCLLFTLSLIPVTLFSTVLHAQAPDGVYIRNFVTSGNGCRPGTYSYLLSPDKQTLQILFSDFIAELAPANFLPAGSAKPRNQNCNISFQMQLPPGISQTWDRTEHRGFVDTTGGATAELTARYHLTGPGGFNTVRSHSWQPDSLDAYTIINEQLGGGWTKCGGVNLLSINTSIRLAGQAHGYNTITVDDITHRSEIILRFRYRSCQ